MCRQLPALDLQAQSQALLKNEEQDLAHLIRVGDGANCFEIKMDILSAKLSQALGRQNNGMKGKILSKRGKHWVLKENG